MDSYKYCIKFLLFPVPMIQNLEMTMRSGAVPQAPQFRPSPVNTIPPTTKKVHNTSTKSDFVSKVILDV